MFDILDEDFYFDAQEDCGIQIIWTIEGEEWHIRQNVHNSESSHVRFRTTHITRPSHQPLDDTRMCYVLANLSHSCLDRPSEAVGRIGGKSIGGNEG